MTVDADDRQPSPIETVARAINGTGETAAVAAKIKATVEGAGDVSERAAADVQEALGLPGKAKVKATWRDWTPEGMPEPADDELITRAELLERIHAADVDISERTLQLWEAAGILPGPVRRWHNGATRALYAPWVTELAILANAGSRSYGSSRGPSTEQLATSMREVVRFVINRADVHTWGVMRDRIPAALAEFADRYEAAMGERPASAEIRIRRNDGHTMDIYGVSIPVRS